MLRMVARQAAFSIFTLNILRSLARKIGVFEIIKRRQEDRIVLVDEGTVLLAHNVFVYSGARYTGEEIATFASLVPLPDIIIYIKAPVEILVQRALLRPDPPREIRSRNPALIEKHVNRAVEMFDQLTQASTIQSRLLIVENPHSNYQECDDVIERIVKFIINNKSAIG
ncbi:MAG TPA: hypothetical protein VJ821_10520 [Anaerolineales bacterium]|nr:hypothetical protein [Anaerolineales bacterium]